MSIWEFSERPSLSSRVQESRGAGESCFPARMPDVQDDHRRLLHAVGEEVRGAGNDQFPRVWPLTNTTHVRETAQRFFRSVKSLQQARAGLRIVTLSDEVPMCCTGSLGVPQSHKETP